MDEHIKCFIQLVAFYQINLLVCRLLFIKLSKWCLRINENAEFMWKLSFESTPNGLKARRYMVICDSWKLASVSFYNAKCLSSWKNGFVQLLSLQLGFISTPDNFSVQFFWRQFNDGQQLSILLNRIELFSMIHYVTRSAHQTSAGLRYSGALRHPMSCHGRVEKNRQFWIFLVSDFWKSISCSVNLSSSGSRSRLPHTPSALRRCSTLWFHSIWRDKRSLLLWHDLWDICEYGDFLCIQGIFINWQKNSYFLCFNIFGRHFDAYQNIDRVHFEVSISCQSCVQCVKFGIPFEC